MRERIRRATKGRVTCTMLHRASLCRYFRAAIRRRTHGEISRDKISRLTNIRSQSWVRLYAARRLSPRRIIFNASEPPTRANYFLRATMHARYGTYDFSPFALQPKRGEKRLGSPFVLAKWRKVSRNYAARNEKRSQGAPDREAPRKEALFHLFLRKEGGLIRIVSRM